MSGTRKGIVLAGGTGTRLRPVTSAVSKQLLPVYDKPMIYYPLSVLMLAGIREILIITTPRDRQGFEDLLGDGSQWGVQFQYSVQPHPGGLAQAFHVGADFLAGRPSALILGDNIFHGQSLSHLLDRASGRSRGATIFTYRVADPRHYGVVSFDHRGKARTIEEKPSAPASHFAVTGLYFYDERAVDLAQGISPSVRGEFEITDLNRLYLEMGELEVEQMGRGFSWLDTGTHASLLDASLFIKIVEDRQGVKICCPEEVAWRKGFISDEQLTRLASPLRESGYGDYLLSILDEGSRP